jgi:hypothetical protein
MTTRCKFLSRTALGLSLLLMSSGTYAEQDKVLQFKSASKAAIKGQQHMVMLAATPKGRIVRLMVANTDPTGPYAPVADQLTLIQSLKPGDLLQLSWDTADNTNTLSAVARYTPKPGELTNNGYVFVKADVTDSKNPDSGMTVTLNKLGDVTTAVEPTEKDAAGQLRPTPLVSATVAALKPGDSVWVDLSTGPSPTIQVIMPYADPASATLAKFLTADVNGEKAPAVQLSSGNAPTEAVIPGKDVAGKWVVDTRIMAAAHRCKVGEQVLYRIQTDGTTTWLRDIAPVPAQPVAARQTPQNNGPTDANGLPRGRTVGGANAVPGVGGIGGLGGF